MKRQYLAPILRLAGAVFPELRVRPAHANVSCQICAENYANCIRFCHTNSCVINCEDAYRYCAAHCGL